jgi:tetratricopeptide (TPR) repeat protein
VLRAGAKGRDVLIPAAALCNDLDWVILKALEKLPDDRYPSVTALADDLQNYLNDLPVSVGPPTAWYQFQKFARRHQTAVALGSLVAALTVGAAITVTLVYLDESRARKVADDLRRRSEISEQTANAEVRKSGLLVAFLTELLDRAAEHVDQGRNAEVLRLALSESAPQIDEFADQPELQAQLYHRLGDIYSAMDEPKAALPLFQKEWQTLVTLHGAQDIRSLKVLYEVARTQARATLRAEAIETFRLVSSGYEALGKTQSEEWFDSRRRTAVELIALNRQPEAAVVLHDLSDRRDGSRAMGHENNNFLRAMAELHWLMGEFQEAEALLEQSLAQLSKPHLARSRAATLRAYSKLEVQRGNFAQAAQRLEQGLLAEIAADGPTNHQLINRWIEVARLYARVGRFGDAATATQSARELARARGHLSQQIHALQASAEIHEQAGKLEQALLYRRECEPLAAQVVDSRRTWLEQWRAITSLHTRLAQPEQAEKSAMTLWRLILLDDQQVLNEDRDYSRTLFETLIMATQGSKTIDPVLPELWKKRRSRLETVGGP